jgi:O-methyltransferase domain
MNEMNPFETLRQISGGYCLARAVHVLAELNVADALGETAQSAIQLAGAVGADAEALSRILRLVSAHGVFEQRGDTYQHSAASRMLRTDHPRSMRAFVRMFGLAINWDAYRELEYSVKTGRRAMEKTLPEGIWSYLGGHPEANSIFNAAMLAKAQGQIPAIVKCGNFSRFKIIGDIGGGRGHLLRAILEAAPTTKGILFDLPRVVNEAADLASSRLTLQGGDFFKDALPKCDAYILMEVIHDWPDREAVRILQEVRRAAAPRAALFLIEAIVPEGPQPDWSKMLDIHMLTLLGGKQRTLKEYDALLRQADFEFKEEIDTGTGISIIETLARQT